EGIEGRRVFRIGNPIYEVLRHHEAQIEASDVHARLNLEEGRYFLVTMHREENVDVEERLRSLVAALEALSSEYALQVVCSIHPRTRRRMEAFGFGPERDGPKFLLPLGLVHFVALAQNAFCVCCDSGPVQEGCATF